MSRAAVADAAALLLCCTATGTIPASRRTARLAPAAPVWHQGRGRWERNEARGRAMA
ncbi:hypothetical protein [Lichenibacterium minor]|uniref:hypothetical protein n=1 Tax=Lichenibacterium minor TaxID=2316528 RepID=UPI0013EC234C|nr:hypothetical protein [Lichenibacterium minor]